MNLIAQWLLDNLMDCFGYVFEMVAALTTDLFQEEIIMAVLMMMKSIGLALYAVSLCVLIIKMMIRLNDGDKISFSDLLMRMILGGLIMEFGVELMINFYSIILDFSGQILNVISSFSSMDVDILDIITASMPPLLTLALLVVAFFFIFKTIMNLLERFWQLFVTLCLMYLYNAQFVQGNDEAMFSWFKQLVAIALTQAFQALVLTEGINLYVTSDNVGMFLLAIGAIVAASNIEKTMNSWGLSVGGKLGNVARNSLSVVSTTVRMIK